MNDHGGPLAAFRSADRLSAEDEERFADLYRQWYAPLVRLCRRYVGPYRDAEALAQEAFVKAWASRARFANDRPFWPWLATIARRLCINDVVRQRRRDDLLAEASPRSAVARVSTEDELEGHVNRHDVRRVLRDLPRRHQRLLWLRDIEGWSYEDIADFEGVTVESVRGSLKRARASFRQAFERVAGGVLGGLGVLGRPGDWLRDVSARLGRHADRLGAAFATRGVASDAAAVLVGLLLLPPPAAPGAIRPPTGAEVAAPGVPPSTSDVPPSATADSAGPAAGTGVGAVDRPAIAPPGPPAEQGAVLTAEDEIVEFTPSPNYDEDHTVFANGTTSRGCPTPMPTCPALYKSVDGGTTWARLPSVGRKSGWVLLPPAFPRDGRIFSASKGELAVSEDGGGTFRSVAIVEGRGVMSPRFSDGDPRIVFSSGFFPVTLLSEYRDDVQRVQPFSLPLPLGATPVHFAFSPRYAEDGRVLVGGVQLRPSGLQTSSIFSCTTECTEVLGVTAASGSPAILWDGPADEPFAWSGRELYRSRDGGRSFQEVRRPGDPRLGLVSSVVQSRSGRLFLTLQEAYPRTALYVSDDRGDSWALVHRAADDSLMKVTLLPDGTLLAVAGPRAGRGVLCSTDEGRTWARMCGPRAPSP